MKRLLTVALLTALVAGCAGGYYERDTYRGPYYYNDRYYDRYGRYDYDRNRNYSYYRGDTYYSGGPPHGFYN